MENVQLQSPQLEIPQLEDSRVQAQNGTRPDAVYASQLTSLNRRNDSDPHFFGSVKIDGLWYQIATWINVVNKIQNLNSAYTLMTEEQAIKAQERDDKFQAERLKRATPLSAPPVNPLAAAMKENKDEVANTDSPTNPAF